ncbi:MAG: hypothetical protein ACODAJ_13560, partial [Planctomycetota bacterium]
MSSDERHRSPQDDIDTRKLSPQQRRQRRRTYGWLLAIVLCAVAFLAGYTLGRGQRPRRRGTVVESEVQTPDTATTPRPKPPPPPGPLARLEAVEATMEDTRLTVRFATAVDGQEAEQTGSYAIQPDVMVSAAELADD